MERYDVRKFWAWVLIGLMAGMAGILFAPLSVDSYEVIPSPITPGQEGVIQITLQNVQPSGATTSGNAVEGVAVYYSSVPGMEFTTENPVRVGTVEGGTTTIATIPIRILPGARGGILSPSFQIAQQESSIRQTLVVPVKVDNPPLLTLSSDTQTLRDADTLNITLTNNGGAASRLILKLNESGGFSLVGSDQIVVGDVTSSRTISLGIDSRNAAEGVNSIPFLLTYQKEDGETATESKMLSVTVKKEKADVVFAQESTVVTSKNGQLKLTVRNIGRPLEDFRVIWEDSGIQARESNEIRLGTLASGEEKAIAINVFADSAPGIRNAQIQLKWIEQDVEKEEDTTIPLTVSSDADVALFIDAKPAPLTPNTEHTLSVLVSNIGSYRIENVEIALNGSDVLDTLNAQDTQYIGGLENDDFSTVQYKIRMKNLAPGTYPLGLRVRYKDFSGAWVEKNVQVEVAVRNAEDGNGKGGPGLLPILVLVVAGIGIAYWWRKRNKRMDKDAAR